MYCKWCGNKIDENSKFCPNCGKEVLTSNDGSQSVISDDSNMVKGEKANVWFAVLSFFIPLAGLIVFLVKKDKEPKTAKVSGICAIVGFLLSFVLSIILFFLVINGGLKLTESLVDKSLNTFDKVIDKNEDVIDHSDDNITNDWDDYEFVINGKELELPCSYKELKSVTGFSAKSSDENSVLSNNYYTIVNMYKNDKLALSIEVLNDTGSDAKYMDSKVTRVSQSEYQVSNGADKITFPGGLVAGQEITEDKIKRLFGEPTDVNNYSSDGYESITYTYNEDTSWTTTNYFKIQVVNGVISEITLDNRNDD